MHPSRHAAHQTLKHPIPPKHKPTGRQTRIGAFGSLAAASQPQLGKMLDMVTLSAIIGNVGSVVGVVILNKYIVAVDAFNYMVFLSFTHFVFTYLGCVALLKCGFFTYKSAPLRGVLPVALVRGRARGKDCSLGRSAAPAHVLARLARILTHRRSRSSSLSLSTPCLATHT